MTRTYVEQSDLDRYCKLMRLYRFSSAQQSYLKNSRREPSLARLKTTSKPPTSIEPLMIITSIAVNIKIDWKTSVHSTAFIPPIVQ